MYGNKLKEIESYISNKIAQILHVSENQIDCSQPFETYGIDSITAVRMVGELEDYLDVDLPSSLLWEYNNIEKLSKYLITLINT